GSPPRRDPEESPRDPGPARDPSRARPQDPPVRRTPREAPAPGSPRRRRPAHQRPLGPDAGRPRSVMTTSLEELDAVAPHQVDQAVLLRDPPRPRPGQLVLQRLGLAHADERFTQGRLDQLQDAEGNPAIVLDPGKILAELRVKDGVSR